MPGAHRILPLGSEFFLNDHLTMPRDARPSMSAVDTKEISLHQGSYDHYSDEQKNGNGPRGLLYAIDKQLHCCTGAVRKGLGFFIFGTLMCLPLICAGFMIATAYHAYHYEQTCSGPELWAGMLQGLWWMFFWWTMMCLFATAAMGPDCREIGMFFLTGPYWIMAFVITAFLFPDAYYVDGDVYVFISCLVLFLMLIGMFLWPFFAPLIIAAVLEGRTTWVRYYDFKIFYNGYHFASINPANTTQWPDGKSDEIYAMPGRKCEDRKCEGGWAEAPPRGLVGLIEDIIVPNMDPAYCAQPNAAPGWIRSALLNMNTTKYNLGQVMNCSDAFSYTPVLSSAREVYDTGEPASFCSDTATMPECCDLVRGFFASQACLFIPCCLFFVYGAWKERTPYALAPAIIMVACGGAGFFMSLDIIQ